MSDETEFSGDVALGVFLASIFWFIMLILVVAKATGDERKLKVDAVQRNYAKFEVIKGDVIKFVWIEPVKKEEIKSE
jgi:hypothetical protein